MIVQRATPGEPPPWAGHLDGSAAVGPLLAARPGTDTADVLVATATFEPGSRTHWHSHDGGQLLVVVAGRGLVAVRDQEPQEIGAGDTVWTPAGEEHWHGATSDGNLTHVAVTWGDTHWHAAAATPVS